MNRLPDHLPASDLILRGASPWQVAHGLLYLSECLLKVRKATVEEALGHNSPIHRWINMYDFKLDGRKDWRRIIAGDAVDLEARLK